MAKCPHHPLTQGHTDRGRGPGPDDPLPATDVSESGRRAPARPPLAPLASYRRPCRYRSGTREKAALRDAGTCRFRRRPPTRRGWRLRSSDLAALWFGATLCEQSPGVGDLSLGFVTSDHNGYGSIDIPGLTVERRWRCNGRWPPRIGFRVIITSARDVMSCRERNHEGRRVLQPPAPSC
jgi:hypothetical protein